jgi:hypothetical protein
MAITALEKRLMLDASLGAIVSSVVFGEDTVNATPQVLDSDVTISGTTTTDFTGEALTLSTDGGAEDQLNIVNEGTGAGQIGFDGSNVTFEGTLIGTLSSNGTNGSDLTIDLNANATQAGIERLIENITYQNTSDDPTQDHVITIALGAFFSEDVGVTIVAQNDDPVATTNAGTTVNEGDSVTITTADLDVTDTDDADSDIVFNISSTTSNGRLELTTNTGVAITSFTRDDLVNNRVVYVHDDSDTVSDSFTFTATDGDVTLTADTFNITINAINDPLAFGVNSGTTVFENFSTTLAGGTTQFGNQLLTYGAAGDFGTWNGTVDSKSLQYSLVFTMPGSNPTGVPGEVLFESGGSGVGLGLFLNSSMELDFYSGAASGTPRLSSDALVAGQQYAVVVEIDQGTDEIRMHYTQAGNFDWYTFGRVAEKTLTGYTSTDHSGSDNAGVGRLGGGSYGGYNGAVSGTTTFQGSLDSNMRVTEFPGAGTPNTMLAYTDTDTPLHEIVYTITTDVANGTLYRSGVALVLNDTFTQADLDLGFISYTSTGGGGADPFDYTVTDGVTSFSSSFVITIDTSNTAPEILTTTTILDEDFEGGASGWNNNTTTSSGNDLTEFWGEFSGNINVSGNQELFQTFATSGTQNYIVVEFDFYRFDSWDNEYFYAFVDDTQVFSNQQFNTGYSQEADGQTANVSYTVQERTDVAGYVPGTSAWTDQILHYTMVIDTSDPTFKLGFGSNLNSTSLTDETFGIDNLKITEIGTGGANNQEFLVTENADNGDFVGTLQAIDENAGQPLTYSVTGGTGNGLFSIDATSGEITVTDNSTFDFEMTTSYTLDVSVTDGALSDTQTITIQMVDVIENTSPTFTGAGPFSIAEDAANNDDVGTVVTTDAEGDNVTYSITSGNTDNVFKINATTGLIEVNDATQLDYESQSSYNLSIRAWDDNTLSLYRNQTITINLTDIDEAPSLDIEYIIESQNTGVIYSADTGNFYLVETTNYTYAQALANAPTEFLNGVAGHLVTITSQAEYNFVRDYASPSHIRLALSDGGEEGKWIWTAGPDAGTQITQGNTDAIGLFNNWLGAEPNSGVNNNSALFHSNNWWYDNWEGAYDSVVEWEGEDIINNSYYRVNHSNADASDVNVGDSVGFIQGLDPEGDALDFTIENGNTDGIFEIDVATGEIRILDTTNLDATVQDTYTLTIRATENAGSQFDETDIIIKFNDDFTISANNTLNVDENSSAVLTTAYLNISDLDNVAADTRFFASTLPANGELEHSDNPGFQISSFTLDDLQNGRISYVHGGSETTSDSFVFEVSDGGRTSTGNTFNINIGTVNDAPVIAANTGTTVIEGARVTITDTMLDSTDTDDTETGLTYTASSYVRGHIEVNGVTQNTFTQADIDNGVVEFVHDSNEGATAEFAFSLADGGEDSSTPATGTFTLNVTPVNDAPVVTTNTGTTIIEGGQTTITNTMLNVTDPDDSGTGLTYTLSNIINGQVELSTNAGTPIISFTQADLDAGRLVFVHDGNENDSSFDISIADGGENSAGTDSATFNLSRIAVNDAPVISTNLGSSVNQNSIVILKNAVLNSFDPDDTPTGLTYTITGTTNGQLELFANPNVAITTFTQDDIDNSRIVFRHSGPPGVADFDFTLADGGEDLAGSASGTFDLTVDNTNDAPIISTNTGPTVLEGSTTTLTTAMIDSFDPDDFGADLTWTASNLSNGVVQVNGVTQNTFTQADLDGGLVTFIHDDSQTLTAGFDMQVADGGEDLATPATGAFNITVTAVNDGPTIIVNDGSPNIVNFNDYTISTFDPSQDGSGGSPTSATVSPDGSTLEIGNNSWKKVSVPYTLTANTVLSLEFRADSIGEIFGIGFDNDNSIGGGGVNGYQLGGTQTWSGMDQSFNTYDQGDGWVRFDLPIGTDYTGAMSELVFVLDDDASPTGTALFRNVNFYESTDVLSVNEGATFNITNAHINSVDVDDTATGLNFTASNLTNGHVEVGGVTQNTFTQDDVDNNRVTFVHDGTDTLNAGFDISLIDGGEDSTTADTGTFSLIVNPLNDSAVIGTNTGATLAEGASLTITQSMLNEADPDDHGTGLTYTASSLTNGHIEVNGATQNTFTQNDIALGRVAFIHDGSETAAASFDISLADNLENGAVADTGTFNMTITPVNDAPVQITNTGETIAENAATILSNTRLSATDIDNTNANLLYTITALPAGTFENTNTALTLGIGDTFTQGDIDSGFVRYTHDGSEAALQTLSFTLSDGPITLGATDYDFTITPVNDAPVQVTNTGETIAENAATVLSNTRLAATDADNTNANLLYTITAVPAGTFENTNTALALGIGDTFTQGDIDSGFVRYTHDGSEAALQTLSFTLSDGPITLGAADYDFTITPVNDAPVQVTNTGETIAEGGTTILNNARLAATDADNPDTNLIYTITALPAGTVENTNTVSTLAIGDTFTQGDIDNGFIGYTHDGAEHTSQTLSFTLGDGAITLAAADYDFTITPVNDTPYGITISDDAIDENSNVGSWIGDLNGMDVDLPGDAFTFSIMADPDNKFMLVGNQLFSNAELDFETSAAHSLMIRADDGNGGMVDRMITINIRDINENPFVAPSSPTFIGGSSIVIEEESIFDRLRGKSLIQASFSGDEFAMLNAAYGEGGLGQILQENTTFRIREINNDTPVGENSDPVKDAAQSKDQGESDQGTSESSDFTNMRHLLKTLEQYNDEEIASDEAKDGDDDHRSSEEKINDKFYNLDDAFEDVLTYHEQRKAKLREALL